MAHKRKWGRSLLPALPEVHVIADAFSNGCAEVAEFQFVNYFFICLLKEFLLYHIDLHLTLMQSHLKGLMLSTPH